MIDSLIEYCKILAFCVRGLAFSVFKVLHHSTTSNWACVQGGLRARLVLDPVTLTSAHNPPGLAFGGNQGFSGGHYVQNDGS